MGTTTAETHMLLVRPHSSQAIMHDEDRDGNLMPADRSHIRVRRCYFNQSHFSSNIS